VVGWLVGWLLMCWFVGVFSRGKDVQAAHGIVEPPPGGALRGCLAVVAGGDGSVVWFPFLALTHSHHGGVLSLSLCLWLCLSL
jgi:hypothetical protein